MYQVYIKRNGAKKYYFGHLILFLELLGLLFSLVQPIYAHSEDATLQLANASVGPYYLNVWTYPGILRAGAIHFMVAVDDATGTPALDANVIVQVSAFNEENQQLAGQAVPGRDPHNRFVYETDLNIEEEGVYQVTVVVADITGKKNEAAFKIEVVSATFMKWIIYFLLVQALIVSLWFILESLKTWGLNRALNSNKTAWEKTRSRRQK